MSETYWSSKPYWCKPWSIILFGLLTSLISWLLFHLIWLTLTISFVIILWWLLFLRIVPDLYIKYSNEIENEYRSQ